MRYSLPSLPYAYDALEPHFDQKTMEIHHSKHHQTYVNNANTVLAAYPELDKYTLEELIQNLDKVPADQRTWMRNNAGGHFNHSFFWKQLKIGTVMPSKLQSAIERDFGSVERFKEKFEKTALACFGSGWAWLVLQGGKLRVVSTVNQDSPVMGEAITGTSGLPIIALDVWEHAYYLKYQNKRLDYIKAFWNVVNWDEVAVRFHRKMVI
ncbi:Superoxide dismutase [Mn] [Serratia symbiotica]|nr:Superoxide dismutase [Mn] [Serratia symbiotica]